MRNKKSSLLTSDATLAGIGFSLSMFIYVIIAMLGGVILTFIVRADGIGEKAITAVFAPIAIIVVLTIISVGMKYKFNRLVLAKKCSVKYFGFAIILSAGMLFGLGWVNELLGSALKIDTGLNDIGHLMGGVWEYLLFVLVISVVPAICEEFFFRGFVYSGVRKSGVLFGIIISGVMFALYHCSLAQLIYQLIYGMLLALLTEKAGSVFPAMLAHFANNFAIITFTYFNVAINLLCWWIILIGLVLIAVFMLFMFLPIKKREEISAEEKSKLKLQHKQEIKKFFIVASVGLVICVTFIITSALGL